MKRLYELNIYLLGVIKRLEAINENITSCGNVDSLEYTSGKVCAPADGLCHRLQEMEPTQ